LSEELIIREIDSNKEEYIHFLRELIQAESYNPPGNEKNVADIIERYLKDANIECELFSFGENRANLIADLNKKASGKNLLYNGHMDVVPPGEENAWKFPPLSAHIKRKRFMYGRGTSDMKGGLAAMVVAMKVLKKLNIELSGNLILNGVADEETGGKWGTQWCLQNKLNSVKCDFVVVGETTGFDPLPKAILLGEKGRVQLKLIANGVSCHASAPFLGKNAIYIISDIIQNFDKLDDLVPKVDPPLSMEKLKSFIKSTFPNEEIFERIYKEQPLLPNVVKSLTQFTKSLTMIKAGIKSNVVPDRCEATIDFRLLPGQSVDSLLEGLTKLIESLGYTVKEPSEKGKNEEFVQLEIQEQSEPSFWKNWENSEDLNVLFNIIDDVYEKKPFYFMLPASSDANYFRNTNYCKATVLFGPGVGNTAHAIDEYIELEDFIKAIKVYALFAYTFLK
jgi:succinyl-diaminopimelate desuccinylase